MDGQDTGEVRVGRLRLRTLRRSIDAGQNSESEAIGPPLAYLTGNTGRPKLIGKSDRIVNQVSYRETSLLDRRLPRRRTFSARVSSR